MTNKEQIKEVIDLLKQLNNNEVRPSKIVGTGLKNPRNVAYKYLTDKLEHLIFNI